MGGKMKWLAIALLPLVAACSSSFGITKKEEPPGFVAKKEMTVAPTESDTKTEGAFHIVGKGETLRHICDVYGLDLAKVSQINKFSAPYTLKAGETVFLPAAALLPEQDPSDRKQAKVVLCSLKTPSSNAVTSAIRGRRHALVPSLQFPVPHGVLSSPFGYRWGRFHTGLDIAAAIGSPVTACADGRVIFTGSQKKFRRYGTTVLIDHGKGVYTYYAHLSTVLVKKNQVVKKGHQIALVGNTGRSTGPHLHLEVRVTNKMYNPLAYFTPTEMSGIAVARRFTESPMGPVLAKWRIPDLLTEKP